MKKKHPEHVNLERWLVSYADFMTLMFAFFVVMYATSQANLSKFNAVSKSMRDAFGTSAGPVGMIDMGGAAGGNTVQIFHNAENPGGRVLNLPAGKTHVAGDPDPDLQLIRDKLEETISLELGATELSDKLQLMYDSRGLIVRLAAKDFFDQGDPVIRPELISLLDRIGRVLATTKRLIRIEGHTDRSEDKSAQFESGWELSSERAAWVVKYFIRRFSMEPSRLGVAGYSHFRPISEREDEFSRGKNRRVEIIILNNQYEEPGN